MLFTPHGCGIQTRTYQFGGKVTVNYLYNLTFLKLFLLFLILFIFFLHFWGILETKWVEVSTRKNKN